MLCAAAFLCLFSLPAAAQKNSIHNPAERILNFHSDIRIHTDGSMTIAETITVQATGFLIKRGIYRDLPKTYYDAHGRRRFVEYTLLQVQRDGRPEYYHSEIIPGGTRYYIGRSDIHLPPGTYTYKILYKVAAGLRHLPDFDELYWNITGNDWRFAIDRASASVYLPPGAPLLQYSAYTGYTGIADRNYKATELPGILHIETTARLDKFEGLTVAAAFPKGHVVPLTEWQRFGYFLRVNIWGVIGGILFVLLNIFYFLVWVIRGQDPEKGVIIPQFSPPVNFSPVLTHYVFRRKLDISTALAAALTDLAVKGIIKIDELPQKGLRLLSKKEYRLTLLNDDFSSLPKAEKFLVHRLFSGVPNKQRLLGRKNDEDFAKIVQDFEKTVEREYKGVYFITNMSVMVVGVFLSGLYVAFMMDSGMFIDPVILPLCLGFIIVNIMYVYLLEAPTMRGRKKMDHIEGFKIYLETAEKDRIDFLHPPEMTPDLFEKFLPYAIALGVENRWAAKFKNAVGKDSYNTYNPRWYHGNSHFNAGQIGGSLSKGLSGAVGSAGGGSSGGGGGGGGGGGW